MVRSRSPDEPQIALQRFGGIALACQPAADLGVERVGLRPLEHGCRRNSVPASVPPLVAPAASCYDHAMLVGASLSLGVAVHRWRRVVRFLAALSAATAALTGSAFAACAPGSDAVWIDIGDNGFIEIHKADDPTYDRRVITPDGVQRYVAGPLVGTTSAQGRVFFLLDDPKVTVTMLPAERQDQAYWGGILVKGICPEKTHPEFAIDH